MEFIMTFKKINKRAQSIFEYFILTAAVCATVLFFATTDSFKSIKISCEKAFNGAVTELVK
jgi:hypothetical protein